ncbi:hypothetical protein [Nitratidesulfovibrio vulgaris]|uniref:hypothetical protein n=1 Tax=Nitratidesulfovibrio vulgaris TaxID=881 RepID=UPI0022FFDA30|nr:hypothetical protein [Nitratidesulfovibrio vulgaris]WCB45054.1 hypothetical protein PH214_08085 [Nitratidesulfovibrio vulgaris]
MGLALFWILCGFAASVVASSKGRSGCLWFIGGTLLGPIGLLMVGFMPKVEPDEPPRPPMRTCPFCAEEIQPAAIVCKHCGREIGVQESTVSPTGTSHDGGVIDDIGTAQREKTSGAFHVAALVGAGLVAAVAFAAIKSTSTPEVDGMEGEYGKTWRYEAKDDISSKLLQDGVSECPRYVWRAHKRDATAYLVYCALSDGKWSTYTIYNGLLFGPYEPRPELIPHDLP